MSFNKERNETKRLGDMISAKDRIFTCTHSAQPGPGSTWPGRCAVRGRKRESVHLVRWIPGASSGLFCPKDSACSLWIYR